VYENPSHSVEERTDKWMTILNEFSTGAIDFSGLEEYRKYSWQRQLHLFEFPLYYIEYGFAQLGAIGLWMQFKQNKEAALNNYMLSLRLGGTKTLPELYSAAGLTFNFATDYIEKLMRFVKQEMDTLNG
jgi:oligoendopeptidase F